MKMKRIGIVVLAAAVLMAMTIGIAYAQGYAYGPYNMVSHFSYRTTSATLDSQQPSGNFNVNTGDTLGWGNVFYSDYSNPIDGYLQTITTPIGGLATYLSAPQSVPGLSRGTGTLVLPVTVADGSSSYTIGANHLYKFGNNYYGSPSCWGMTFN